MKTFTLFILLAFSIPAYAQKEVSYIDYHKQIISAEQQLLYFNTPSGAIKKYKEIFTAWEKPFAKDCFIALQLACMVKDTARATFFFQKCFENGVEWNTVLLSSNVETVFNNPEYKKRIGALCDEYHKACLKAIDTAFKSMIHNMYKHEGRLRSEAQNSKEKIALWTSVADSNMYELIPIIKKKGFPGERRIGLNIGVYKQVEDNRTGDKRHEYDFDRVDIFLSCHAATLFFHHRCGYALLKEELMQAVIEGELHPREYALMYEWSHNYFAVKHWDDEYHDFRCEAEKQGKSYNTFIEPFRYSTDTGAVNKDRAEIGICTLEHDAIDNNLYLYFGMFQKI